MSHDAQRTDGSWDGPNYAAEHATVLGIRAWPGPATVSITEVHTTFRRWLGEDYDLDALDVVLATAAVEQLGGDPVWVLVLSGSGNAKTETVAALAGTGATITSTITSEGALLSATSRKDATKDATGGLLRKIGDRGVVVIKDFTSILSMNRDVRASVLAALREVYDGKWERNVGTDGGRTLTWTGRLVVIGAVTSAYDSAHGVIAAMGDRFALVRVDSNLGRHTSGRQALRNVDHEVTMRADLAQAVGDLLGSRARPCAAHRPSGGPRLGAAVAAARAARRAGSPRRPHQGSHPTPATTPINRGPGPARTARAGPAGGRRGPGPAGDGVAVPPQQDRRSSRARPFWITHQKCHRDMGL